MNKLRLKALIVLLLCFGCKKGSDNSNSDPIMDVPVSLTLNLALPVYFHLQNPGTYVFENGGVKGIVVVHHTDDNFYAFDRSCSYQPNTSGCSRIEVDTAFIQFRCGETTKAGFQKCCDSKFYLDGSVAQAPAKFPLKPYRVSKSGNILNISN